MQCTIAEATCSTEWFGQAGRSQEAFALHGATSADSSFEDTER